MGKLGKSHELRDRSGPAIHQEPARLGPVSTQARLTVFGTLPLVIDLEVVLRSFSFALFSSASEQ